MRPLIAAIHERSGRRFLLLDGRRFGARLRGLAGRRLIPQDDGAYLEPCSAIHMIWMRVPLDVVWLDAEGSTMRVDRSVPPGMAVRICRGARTALELRAGTADDLGLAVGDRWIVRKSETAQML